MDQTLIRNFSLIAHIDHGKSTLADRIMEICGAIAKGGAEQVLDSLELERERGITIKLKAIRLRFRPKPTFPSPTQEEYIFNLIDTPGHVDFSYEVSRSLAACEGAILIVDATQGVQAQTLANFNHAIEAGLTVVPVVNKIDLPEADVIATGAQLVDSLGFKEGEIIKVSAKTGEGVEALLERVVEVIPPPKIASSSQSLIFDSSFDPYKGVVATVRVFGGSLKKGDTVYSLGADSSTQILEAGFLIPRPNYTEELVAGQIGFVVTSQKDISKVTVGDTISVSKDAPALPGYRPPKPFVYLSLFPIETSQFLVLRAALEKFKLSDAALTCEPELSSALGNGFRCGFLGLLHADVVQERLEREYGLSLVATSPTVSYRSGETTIRRPTDLPDNIHELEEPWVGISIFVPDAFVGSVLDLIYEKRGTVEDRQQLGRQVQISAEAPLAEMIGDFYDRLKSVSSGFASLDWEFKDYRRVEVSRLDILVNGIAVDALSQIVVRQKAEAIGRSLVKKLKEQIPRQNFEVPIQAKVGAKIIARETISAYRKDVTAKLYGGDVTRKTKLLEKQKKGKRRMKMVGRVEIPQEAFLVVLKS